MFLALFVVALNATTALAGLSPDDQAVLDEVRAPAQQASDLYEQNPYQKPAPRDGYTPRSEADRRVLQSELKKRGFECRVLYLAKSADEQPNWGQFADIMDDTGMVKAYWDVTIVCSGEAYELFGLRSLAKQGANYITESIRYIASDVCDGLGDPSWRQRWRKQQQARVNAITHSESTARTGLDKRIQGLDTGRLIGVLQALGYDNVSSIVYMGARDAQPGSDSSAATFLVNKSGDTKQVRVYLANGLSGPPLRAAIVRQIGEALDK